MNSSPDELVRALHEVGLPLVLVVSGGGSSLVARLLGVPGASRTVLEVVVPYSQASTNDFLGFEPESYCSASTARVMAERAFQRASRYTASPVVGVSISAALVTDRPKKGEHRAYMGVRSAGGYFGALLTFNKNARDRAGEERAVVALVLNHLAFLAGLTQRIDPELLPGESPEVCVLAAVPVLTPAISWRMQSVDGRLCEPANAPLPRAILSGSFDPLHAAHRHLARVAEDRLGLPVAMELSIANVDKPDLADAEVRRRLAQFVWHRPIYVTRAATFRAKSELFPGCAFVVGADTASRLIDPKYYGGDPDACRRALRELFDGGHRFVVAGRATLGGAFVAAEATGIDPEFGGMFVMLREDEFRIDLSSTSLRGAKRDGLR